MSLPAWPYGILSELAVEQLSVLDDMGKSMVLRKVAAARNGSWSYLAGQLRQTQACRTVKIHAFEFYQYGITPEALREMAPSPGLRC